MDAFRGRAASPYASSTFLSSKRSRSESSDALQSPERRKRLTFADDATADFNAGNNNERDADSPLTRLTAAVGTGGSSWRLSRAHSVQDSQTYLNEQLEHAVALSSIMEGGNSTRNQRESVRQLDIAALLTLLQGAGLSVEATRAVDKHVREAMDVVSYLLHVRSREVEHQNNLSESLRAAEKENARRQHVVEVLRGEVEALRQSAAQQQSLSKAKEQALQVEKKTLQAEKKVLEVQCARLQGVETAFKAQLRRKDAEYERLRKSLQDSVARAAKEKRGITASKPLNGVVERRKLVTATQSNEAKLTKQIVVNLERKNAELLLENDALAASYNALQRQLEMLTGQYKKAVQLFLAQKNKAGGASEELEKLAKAPIDDFTPTPFNMATKQSVPEFISQSMRRLNGKLEAFEGAVRDSQPTSPKVNMDEVFDILQKKLDDAHAIIREQDQLLQASLLGPSSVSHGRSAAKRKASSTRTGSEMAAESTEEVENERRVLAAQRRNLERERQLLQEQAVKLDQDRLEFEVQRHGEMTEAAGEATDSPTYTSLSNRELELCSTPPRPSRSRTDTARDGSLDSPLHLPVAVYVLNRTPRCIATLRHSGTRYSDVLSEAKRVATRAMHRSGDDAEAPLTRGKTIKEAAWLPRDEASAIISRSIISALDSKKTNAKRAAAYTAMEHQQEAVAVVFPSREGGSDKHVLQRIHDRNLVHVHELWEHVRGLEERCAQLNQSASTTDSSNEDVKALQDELERETAQLQQLVQDHAISPAADESSNQQSHPAATDEEVKSQEQDQPLAQVAVVPMTADECKHVATSAYEAIGAFMASRSFETTGMQVLGWTDRRQVEDNEVKFMLIKTFRGLTPAEALDRAWRVMTSPRGMRSMYSRAMSMLIKRVQVVDDDNVLLYRVISSPDGRAVAKSLFLASRFSVGEKRILMYRSVDSSRLLQVGEQLDADGAAQVQSWMNIFSWNVFEARGASGEDCKFACGGIVPGTATTSAQEWLLEVLLLALRWEAAVVGAERSIQH